MKSVSLSAAALLSAALFVPMGTATAAAETCQGQPATIVGTPGGQITGTEGADVIVTNGAKRIDALGGDDLVCATGDNGREQTIAILGAGADTFVAEAEGYYAVLAGDTDGTDTEADVIRSTSGYVVVSTGMAGQPNADTIDLLAATVRWNGVQTAPSSVSVTGGELAITTTGDATMDARTGVVSGVSTSLAYAGRFSGYSLTTAAENGRFTFRGTARAERLKVDAPTTYDRDVSMGRGADTYETNGLGGQASRAKGGGGRDRLLLDLAGERVRADLGRRVTAAGGDTATRIRDFENYTMSATRVDVIGTKRPDRMTLIACRVRVHAYRGKDTIKHSAEYLDGDEWTTPRCGTYRAVIHGGRGADYIQGGPGKDRLIGGWGKDRIDGGPGRDVCQGERVRRCEKRI